MDFYTSQDKSFLRELITLILYCVYFTLLAKILHVLVYMEFSSYSFTSHKMSNSIQCLLWMLWVSFIFIICFKFDTCNCIGKNYVTRITLKFEDQKNAATRNIMQELCNLNPNFLYWLYKSYIDWYFEYSITLIIYFVFKTLQKYTRKTFDVSLIQ